MIIIEGAADQLEGTELEEEEVFDEDEDVEYDDEEDDDEEDDDDLEDDEDDEDEYYYEPIDWKDFRFEMSIQTALPEHHYSTNYSSNSTNSTHHVINSKENERNPHFEEHHSESPDILLEVAADLIDSVNDIWYDPYLLNKTHHDSDSVDQDHHYEEDHDDDTGHDQQNNNEVNKGNDSTETIDLDYNEDFYQEEPKREEKKVFIGQNPSDLCNWVDGCKFEAKDYVDGGGWNDYHFVTIANPSGDEVNFTWKSYATEWPMTSWIAD